MCVNVAVIYTYIYSIHIQYTVTLHHLIVFVSAIRIYVYAHACPAETTSAAVVEYGVMKSCVQFTVRNVDKAHCIDIQYICLLDHLNAIHGTVLTQGTVYIHGE